MVRSFLAQLYWFCDRAFRLFRDGAQALFEGFWMGVLPESVCDIVSEKSYGDGGLYIQDAYLDSGFHFWEDLAVRSYFAPGSRVLVAAAGGGREMVALIRAGFTCAGFECSRPMVAAGQRALAKRGIQASLEWAPPSVAPAMGGVFDGLIVGWNGYGYILPRARRLKFLADLKAQLRPGSPVLVSTAIRHERGGVAVWTPRIANAVRVCTFRPPVFAPGDSFPTRPKVTFLPRQIIRELKDAGFSITTQYIWGLHGAVVAKA